MRGCSVELIIQGQAVPLEYQTPEGAQAFAELLGAARRAEHEGKAQPLSPTALDQTEAVFSGLRTPSRVVSTETNKGSTVYYFPGEPPDRVSQAVEQIIQATGCSHVNIEGVGSGTRVTIYL